MNDYRTTGAQSRHWQRYIPKAVLLAVVQNGADANAHDIFFNVPTPDSRLRVKVSLLWEDNTPGGSVPAATLWLNAADDLIDGVSTLNGSIIPITNLEGTSAAPTAIPADNGLGGYSREFYTSADYINGRLTIRNNGALGWWRLQTRYQPNGVTLSPEEWDIITAQCTPNGSRIKI